MARQRARAALGSHDRRHPAVLQPAEQPPQLGAQQRLVGQRPEQRLDRVQHHALGADRGDHVAEADEQRLEVILAGLGQLGAVDANVLDPQQAALGEAGQIPTERGGVLVQLELGLLEADEYPWLPELGRARHQELQGEQALAGTGSAAHERNPPARKPAEGDLVEASYPGRRLGERRG